MDERYKIEELKSLLDKYPPAMNLDQVAEALNCSRRTVDKKVEQGELKAFTLNPKAKSQNLRVTKAELMAYMLKNTIN